MKPFSFMSDSFLLVIMFPPTRLYFHLISCCDSPRFSSVSTNPLFPLRANNFNSLKGYSSRTSAFLRLVFEPTSMGGHPPPTFREPFSMTCLSSRFQFLRLWKRNGPFTPLVFSRRSPCFFSCMQKDRISFPFSPSFSPPTPPRSLERACPSTPRG